MAEGTPDQDIIIKYTVDAEAALAKNAEMEAAIDVVKKQLIDLSAQGSTAMRTMADSMKQVFAEMRMAQAQEAFGGKSAWEMAKPADIKPFLDAANKDIADYNARINEALRRANEEIVATTKEGAQQRIASEKQVTEIQKSEISKQKAEKQTQAVLEKAILEKTTAAQQEYIMAWTTGTKNMSVAAQSFGTQVQDMKAKIVQASQQSGKSVTEVGAAFKAAGQPIAVVNQALRELNVTASSTPGIFQRVGGAIQVALGIGLEQIVMKTVRAIIDGFKQAADAGFEYAQALVRLQIGTNLLQKAGLNVTMRDTITLIDELNQKFPVFTRKSVIEGVGYLQILSQNLGLSAVQMKNLSEVSGALAVILGKDVGEATKEIALFLSSGYGEALQRAGILASKASVEHELLAMGIKESYNNVDQATRAQAGYNVIMQQATELTKKAEEAQKGNAFALVRAQNAWDNLKNSVGIKLVPLLAYLADTIIPNLTKGFTGLTGIIALATAEWAARITQVVAAFELLFQYVQQGPKNLAGLEDLKKRMDAIFSPEGFQKAIEQARQFYLPDIFTKFTDDAIGAGLAAQDAAQKVSQATQDLHDKLIEEQENFARETIKIETDLERDLEKIDRDGLERRFELQENYLRQLGSINRKLTDDLAAEEIKYQNDVADVLRSSNDDAARANQKYRNAELKAQKDFEEKMRRLREDFILDMEDALRERDARQVLRLIRQYNVNVDRLNREKDAEHEERQRAYRQELKDIEKQKNDKLAALAREHAQRIAALNVQANIERREAAIKYQQELTDLQLSLENQKKERDIRYKEQLTDLDNQHKETLQKIGQALADQYSVTTTMLNQIMSAYRARYGPGGQLEQIYRYMASIITAMNQALSSVGTYQTPSQVPVGSNRQYATGGSFLAASPTIAKFGEIPEIVTMTPVNQTSKTPSRSTWSGNNTSKIALDLYLSPDLEARVVDQALNTSADVMLNIQRRR